MLQAGMWNGEAGEISQLEVCEVFFFNLEIGAGNIYCNKILYISIQRDMFATLNTSPQRKTRRLSCRSGGSTKAL